MYFPNIIVGLDFTELDETILNYVDFVSQKFGFNRIHFIHVTPNLEAEEDFVKEFGNSKGGEPWDEILKAKMKGEVEKHTDFQGIETTFEILEGYPADQIIHWANVKEVDLIVMGKKDVGSGSGIQAKKIARHSAHSMLFVSENAVEQLKEILVPVDYSEHSIQAINCAHNLQSKENSCQLRIVHVYDVPAERLRIIHSYEHMRKMFRKAAEDAFDKFTEKLNYSLENYEVDLLQDDYINPAKQIYRHAKKVKPDLMIMGAKGHSKLELLIIGSVTENILLYYDYSPILILK